MIRKPSIIFHESLSPLSLKEKIQNKLLLLYLIRQYNLKSKFYLGITKLQKLVFLSERDMIENRVKGLNFQFFRYSYGPMSKEVYQERTELQESGLIIKEKQINTTAEGNEVLDSCSEWLKPNKEVTDYIDQIIDEFSNYPTNKLKEYVYELKFSIPGRGQMKIKDVPECTDLLSPLTEEEAEKELRLDEGDVETLDIIMDTGSYSSLKEAIKEVQTTPSHPFTF